MSRRAKGPGFKLRSGNSVPFKQMGEESIVLPKPGSSKEELIEIANAPIQPVENIDLDYGGGFDVDMSVGELSGKPKPQPGKPKSGEKPISTRTPEQIMGIERDVITVKGANKQAHHLAPSPLGKGTQFTAGDSMKKAWESGVDSGQLGSGEVVITADESKSTPERKVRVRKPKRKNKTNKK